MSEPPSLSKIGTLPDGRSYVIVPSAKSQSKDLWATVILFGSLIGLAISYFWIKKLVPEAMWGARFLNNLCLGSYTANPMWVWCWMPLWLVQTVITQVSPIRLRTWRGAGLSIAGLVVVALTLALGIGEMTEPFAVLNGLWIVYMGLVFGHLLRGGNIKPMLAGITDPSLSVARRAGRVALCVATVVLAVVVLNYLVFQAGWQAVSAATWGYTAVFMWGLVVSRLSQERPRHNPAEIPA